ncbi:MAG TPA: hypothetical protein VEH84_10920 [Alphaproteobacteria bacterium]|nr:hypothetical protein [Alphaproteobacteria bacterium]
MPAQTLFLCQPYSVGQKGHLRSETPVLARDATAAKLRAERMIGAGSKIVGVDVVQQEVDAEAGDYSEPVFLARLGRVPELHH